jgi:hypothetical protein
MDPDGTPAILVDNVSITTRTNQTGYDCSGHNTAAGTQMVRNESFTNGRLQWGLWGDLNFSITNDAMYMYRPAAATRPGVLFQTINYNVPANSPLYTKLTVSNTASTSKSIQVMLRDQWREIFTCVFNIPANTAPTDLYLRDTTSVHWGRPTLSVALLTSNPAGDPELIVDDVTLHYRPNNPITTSRCTNQPYTPLSGDNTITDGVPVKPDPLVLPEANSEPPPIPNLPGDGELDSTPPISEPPTIPGF